MRQSEGSRAGVEPSWSPAFDTASVSVCATLPSSALLSSLDRGWRSTLVEHRLMPNISREFSIAPTTDTHIILRLRGSHRIETRERGTWSGGPGEIGSLHVIAEGESRHVRYTALSPCEFGHVFIPRATLVEAAELVRRSGERAGVPRLDGMHLRDPALASTCRALLTGLNNYYPDVYAEQATLWLAMHALVHYRGTRHDPWASAATVNDARIRRVLDLIGDAYDQPLTLGRLAQEAGVTKYHFTRLFRARTGVTPVAYLEQVRLAAARHHLRCDDRSIAQIAALTGFGGPDQFSAAFKRVHGVPPSVYRTARRTTAGRNPGLALPRR